MSSASHAASRSGPADDADVGAVGGPGDGFAEVCASLGDDFGWALGVVFRAYRRAAADVLAELPGGPRGYQVLRASMREGHATQLALAQQLGIDRTVMTYLLDDLEAAGLVARRSHPADRRAWRVVATREGRGRVAALTQRLHHAERELLSPLPAADVARLRDLMKRLATHADHPPGGPAGAAACDGMHLVVGDVTPGVPDGVAGDVDGPTG